MVTLSEEVRRRLRNTDRTHSEKELLEIIRKFTQKMADSGYEEGTRMEVLKSAVTRHLRQVEDWRRGGPSLYDERGEDIQKYFG